jgi:SLOG family YspA-like protein
VRILVCGGRDYKDVKTLNHVLNGYFGPNGITLMIAGGAPGADRLAVEWARSKGIPFREFAANWTLHGKAAGPLRNERMLVEGKPDIVIAFPGGKGTVNMVAQARAAGVKVLTVDT